MHRTGAVRARHTLFPVSDIGAVVETKSTSPDASREVSENTYEDTTKEAKLHEGSASSLRLSGEDYQAFIQRDPNADRGATTPFPAWVICMRHRKSLPAL